jgi:hypothetical protein
MTKLPTFRLSWSMLVVCLAVAWFAIIAFVPRSWVTKATRSTPDGYDIASITILRADVGKVIDLVGLAWFIALVVLALYSLYRRLYARGSAMASAALLGIMSPVVSFINDPAPWQIYGAVRDADGTLYCFAESSFLQGQMLTLARLQDEATFTRTLQPLVVTNGDNPRSFLLVVRPSGSSQGYGQVLLTESGWVLGLRHESRCYVAYNRVTKEIFGHDTVERLSPFMLLGTDDVPSESDVATIEEALITSRRGAPTTDAIREGLTHPNPLVRVLASRLTGER